MHTAPVTKCRQCAWRRGTRAVTTRREANRMIHGAIPGAVPRIADGLEAIGVQWPAYPGGQYVGAEREHAEGIIRAALAATEAPESDKPNPWVDPRNYGTEARPEADLDVERLARALHEVDDDVQFCRRDARNLPVLAARIAAAYRDERP